MVNGFYAFYEVSFTDRKEGRMIEKVSKSKYTLYIKKKKISKEILFLNCQVINFKNQF